MNDILKRIGADRIETVRFVFIDQHGALRGKAVTARAVAGVLENGITIPSTLLLKETNHNTAFDVWGKDAGFGDGVLTGVGDIVLRPNASSFRQLPWSPRSAWILCDVELPDGTALFCSPRGTLADAVAKLSEASLSMLCGFEAEFHIYRLLEDFPTHAHTGRPGGAPKTAPLAQGYRLLDETTYNTLEDVLNDLRHNAEALGIAVRSTEVEFGPSQVEFTFEPTDPVTTADNMVMFRAMAKQVCRRRGLIATFMCRPGVENAASSGWHLHQSLTGTDGPVFMPDENGPGETGKHWIAGLLEHAEATSLLAAPTINGYKRYRPRQLAPDRVCWAHDNKGAMLRALMKAGDTSSRVENRAAESGVHPHLFLAGQIYAGLAGVESRVPCPDPVETPYDGTAMRLPTNFGDALNSFERSDFIEERFGQKFRHWFATIKRAEWNRYLADISDWEQREYFEAY